ILRRRFSCATGLGFKARVRLAPCLPKAQRRLRHSAVAITWPAAQYLQDPKTGQGGSMEEVKITRMGDALMISGRDKAAVEQAGVAVNWQGRRRPANAGD